jgi:hypothetical protein
MTFADLDNKWAYVPMHAQMLCADIVVRHARATDTRRGRGSGG